MSQSGLPSAVLELAKLYFACARDLAEGAHHAQSFNDAGWLHRLFDHVAKSSDDEAAQHLT